MNSKFTFRVFTILMVLTLVFSEQKMIYATGDPSGPAPYINNPPSPFVQNQYLLSPTSRGFLFVVTQAQPGTYKFFLNTPGSFSGMSIQSDPFSGASWANGKWYAAVYSSTHYLVTCDTTTGMNTIIGYLGPTSGYTIALCWDPTTSIMYAITNSNPSGIYTVNLTSGATTFVAWISGSVVSVITAAISNTGTLYGIQLGGGGNFGTINKTTGAWTTIGPLGVIPMYLQGCSFDRSNNTLYWASYTQSGFGILKTINLSTGATTTIGNLYGGAECDGFIIPSSIPQPHDIACGPFLGLPASFYINTPYNIKTKVTNVGSTNETGIPIKWFINGSLTNTSNINLNAGQSDSVSNSWTPTASGTYTLMYVSALPTDPVLTNDTVKTTVLVNLVGISNKQNEIPTEYSLSQNYPNPFNPDTKIRFSVPVASYVKIIVYDVAGREMSRLADNELKAGVYNYDWSGGNIASGIYFYTMQAGNFSETRKMVLIK